MGSLRKASVALAYKICQKILALADKYKSKGREALKLHIQKDLSITSSVLDDYLRTIRAVLGECTPSEKRLALYVYLCRDQIFSQLALKAIRKYEFIARREVTESVAEFRRAMKSVPWAVTSREAAQLTGGAVTAPALSVGYSQENAGYLTTFSRYTLEEVMQTALTGKQMRYKKRASGSKTLYFFTLKKSPLKFNVRAYLELPGYLNKYGYGNKRKVLLNEDPPHFFKVLGYLFHNGQQTRDDLAEIIDIRPERLRKRLSEWRLIDNTNRSLNRLVVSTGIDKTGRRVDQYDLTKTEREVWLVFNNRNVRKKWKEFQSNRNYSHASGFSWKTMFYE